MPGQTLVQFKTRSKLSTIELFLSTIERIYPQIKLFIHKKFNFCGKLCRKLNF